VRQQVQVARRPLDPAIAQAKRRLKREKMRVKLLEKYALRPSD
jgi:hypothetical protein